MPIIHYPDNFIIEVVKHYKMHHNIDATLEKYGIARSTLFKWKKRYEENYFFRISKQPTDAGHKAKAHLDKLNKIVEASKELRCGVTASITEKVAEIKRLESKYSVHVLCEALQIPRGTYYNRKKKGDLPSSYELADTVLTMNTFDEAFEEREKPENLIFHSDQGAQYTSYAFRTHLEELQCRQSFSAPGYPYDNSVCESFFNTLKKEAIYYHIYDSAAELAAVLDEYIEYYNEVRMHRTLKMRTPSKLRRSSLSV